ncbi:uncharacterized mitochondrial protein AtMg00810-like [Nicotiana tomentosiformis]|uniref:uncharacterized mitochondrial protein AtMg00810-like n=1 Tax=Nicotiana tomentosiformis TaxID=4098 RepID=UPI00388C776B
MEEDIESKEKNNTRELITLPKGHRAIGVKWVYKTKKNIDGDMKDTRNDLWLNAKSKGKALTIKNYLEEEVYVEQSLGFMVKNHEDKVLRLRKALYRLKQTPRVWNSCVDKYFQDNGFTRCLHEYALYLKVHFNKDILLVCLYVDDIFFTGNNPSLFEDFKKDMSHEFVMTNVGLMLYCLGLEVNKMEEGIFISQESYTNEILKKFNMLDCNLVNTPIERGTKLSKLDNGEKVDSTFFKSVVGSFRCLTCTIPDILFAVGVVSRFIEAPTSTHLKVARRILRYLKCTIDFGLFYSSSSDFNLMEHCDNDYTGDIYDRKSTIGFVFFLGDSVISWSSKKQSIVTLSTCEAEYALVKKSVYHDRSKHMDPRYHFIREYIAKKEVELKYVKSHDQIADIFTKPLKVEDFQRLRSNLGMKKKNQN